MLKPETSHRAALATNQPYKLSKSAAAAFRPMRRTSTTKVVTHASSSPASAVQYKPIPEARESLPWVGVLFRTSPDQYFQLMYDDFTEYNSRLLGLTLLGQQIVCLRHPEDINRVVKDADNWIKPKNWQRLERWLGKGIVVEPDAARHAAAREILAPAFNAQSVKDLVPIFADVAQQVTDLMTSQQGKEVDMEAVTRRATIDVIGKVGFRYEFKTLQLLADRLLGSSNSTVSPGNNKAGNAVVSTAVAEQCVDIVKAFDDIMAPAMLMFNNAAVPESWIPGFKGYVEGVEVLEGVVQEVLKDRRSSGVSPDDRSLLAFLLKAQQEDPAGIVTDKHIRDQLMTFLLAGSDTTASTLAFSLFEIARNPEVQNRVQQEIDAVLGDTDIGDLKPEMFTTQLPYLTGCINESLRLYPAVTAMARTNLKDEVFGDHLVPAGSSVLLFNYALHRHPDFWARPNEWLPERWLSENVKTLGPKHPDAFNPFSAGSRSCIGRYFAMLEMQVIISVLLRKLQLSTIPGKENLKLCNFFTLNTNSEMRVQPMSST